MTNKELENLFQSKLGARKMDFEPAAWAAMERMLDSKLPIVPWYVVAANWFKGLTAAMVVGFAIYFIGFSPTQKK